MNNEKTIVIYCSGGSGVNIGHLIETQARLKLEKGDSTKFAKIVVHYIDTSESNTKFKGIENNVYLYDNVDGSGSDRTKNKDSIADSIRDILIKHPPGDLSIVINSTGGGSGSVIGPMIASQLLSENKLVICMATQTYGSLKQLRNTVSVLSSYETIAAKRKKVLPILLCDNNEEGETNVNNTFCNSVEMLSILFSGEIERMDTADLEHWINFNKVTDNDIGAVLLDIAYDANSIPKDHTVCAVATLTNGPDSKSDFPRMVEYQTVGFIRTANSEEFKDKSLHFALIDGPIQQAFEARDKELKEADRVTSSRKSRRSIASTDSDDNGMTY